MAAARRYALNSSELVKAIAIRGTAVLLKENPISLKGSKAPTLYRRTFTLTNLSGVHGSSDLKKVSSITFSGFTALAPNQRSMDYRTPTLQLEGQTFFDTNLPQDSIDVLLLIGGPDIPPIGGFMGNKASINTSMYKDQPVRAFLLKGADVTLSQSLPSLVGWRPAPTFATAQAATKANHPIVAIDALRIAVRTGAEKQIEFLAKWLLHPVQPPGVRITAIELLGQAVNQMPKGSKKAEILISLAVACWESERAYPIDAVYFRTLQSISDYIKASNLSKQVRAIAEDDYVNNLPILSEKLIKSLKK